MDEIVKLVIFVPLTHTDIVRKAVGDAGAGKLGNYTHCTFSTKGVGRYIPGDGSHPFIGEVGTRNCELWTESNGFIFSIFYLL